MKTLNIGNLPALLPVSMLIELGGLTDSNYSVQGSASIWGDMTGRKKSTSENVFRKLLLRVVVVSTFRLKICEEV